ncbi:MAG TPA: hypothetical protein VJX66_07440 [Amycolatopsis sp.]|nr:hypothetical protein [Amycolatopsis sp.]
MTSTTPPSLPLWQHSPAQLAQACAAELAAARAATARMGACLVEMDTRGIRDLFGYGSAASWLADVAGSAAGKPSRSSPTTHPTRPQERRLPTPRRSRA